MPSITSLDPATVAEGTGGFTLTINGTNFVAGSVVRWDGNDRATTFVSAAQLTADVAAADLTLAKTVQVAVFNPPPGGGMSAAVALSVASVAPDLDVAPAIVALAPNGTVTFTALDHADAQQPVTWRVNGVPGGTAELGLISASGVYTAPATIPGADSVVVTAVSTTDTTAQRSSAVFFIPNLSSKDYYVAVPRVVDTKHPTPTRYLVVPPGSATSVIYLPITGPPVPLVPIGSGVLTFELDVSAALAGYSNGTLHNVVGRLDYRDAADARVKLTNLSVNVRDGAMPDVVVTALAADAQRSSYVLNIRTDAVMTYPNSATVSRALQLLGGDHFDFVAVIATVTTNKNRVYIGLRNDVQGIGVPVFDNSADWGGAGRLRGVAAFPIDQFFDGAETGFLHELGHAWINFATDAVAGPGRPHWPPSSMAQGIMGFNIPGSKVGGTFPWVLTPLGDGTVRVNRSTPLGRFTPLDLYVMGLLPADSVLAMYVLSASANPNTFVDGLIVPATTYTIADYVAGQGVRVPSSEAAQREFAAAVVALTYGRLLSPAEMAFFDHASARAETTVPLQSTIGLATSTAWGFLLATGGRGTLQTRLP